MKDVKEELLKKADKPMAEAALVQNGPSSAPFLRRAAENGIFPAEKNSVKPELKL